jgi:hypothetical protein
MATALEKAGAWPKNSAAPPAQEIAPVVCHVAEDVQVTAAVTGLMLVPLAAILICLLVAPAALITVMEPATATKQTAVMQHAAVMTKATAMGIVTPVDLL